MEKRHFSKRSRIYPGFGAGAAGKRRRGRGRRRVVMALLLSLALFVLAGWSGSRWIQLDRFTSEYDTASEVAAQVEEAGGEPADVVNAAPELPIRIEPHTIRRNESLYEALIAMSFTPDEVWSLVRASKSHTNLSRVRAGATFSVWRKNGGMEDGQLLSFQMPIAPNKTLLARPTREGFEADVREIPYETRQVGYTGEVAQTLWESAVEAGMDPNLVAELADVFAFDIDFNMEVRKGDRYRLVVEQKYLEGKASGYGRILAAEYVNRGSSHTAFLFENSQGHQDYFREDGDSVRRMFLRSPLRYRRISSRFNKNRFHPVLKTRRPHNGVDYAADRGTPVRSVGDGVVIASYYNGGSGKFVKIRHNGTYQTSYSHLNGYGPGIRKGVRVKQGQVIGYVGTTGLSSGPHLHFAFYQNGRYVDPLSKKFPAANPVPKSEKAAFQQQKAELIPLLPDWPEDGVFDLVSQPATIVPASSR